MTKLDQDQETRRAGIQKTALIWGGVGAVGVALIALWVLGGQGSAVRFGGAAVLGAAAGFGLFRWSFNANSKSAQCGKCGAAFSISRTDRSEKILGSEAKETREPAEDKSTKVTTWTEEAFEVTETYTCAKCNNVTTKTHKSSRKLDEKSVVEPAVLGVAAAAMAAGSADAALAEDGKPKTMAGASKAGATSELDAGRDKYGADAHTPANAPNADPFDTPPAAPAGKSTIGQGKKK